MVLTLRDVGNTWLDYDTVAFVVLVIALGIVELLMLGM